MRGRKPKPTLLKDLHGSQEPRNKDEPVPEVELGDEPPEHFDAEMRQVWFDALRDAPPGLLKSIDSSALEVWCTARVLHRRALKQQARHGLVIPAPNTRLPIQSPYIPIINRQALIMLRAAAELGFSPTSRPRASAVGAGADLGSPRNARGAEENLDDYLDRAPRTQAVH